MSDMHVLAQIAYVQVKFPIDWALRLFCELSRSEDVYGFVRCWNIVSTKNVCQCSLCFVRCFVAYLIIMRLSFWEAALWLHSVCRSVRRSVCPKPFDTYASLEADKWRS